MTKPKAKRGHPVWTARMARFCEEYIIDLNGQAAAIRAGYSPKTAVDSSCRLLKKPLVIKAVQAEMDKRARRTAIDSDKVLTEIAKLAFLDPRRLFNEHGQLLPVKDLPDEIAACVSSVEVITRSIPGGEPTDVEHTSKIRFWDKRASLELLGKHLKLFTDKVEHAGPNGEAIPLSVKIEFVKP